MAYTYSKSMDNSSAYRDLVPDTYYTGNLWGPSEFDTRNVAVVNFIYELPLFHGQNSLTSHLLGGWQISGVAQFQSGTPCGVGTNNDFAGVGEVGNLGCEGNVQFWQKNGPVSEPKQFAINAASPGQYFTTTYNGSPVFTQPAPGTFVTQTGVRDEIYGPGFTDWNLGLFKKFPFNERHGMEFRAEAFDVWNHPNWSGPNYNPTSSLFGKVTGKTNLARNLQLSLRYYF